MAGKRSAAYPRRPPATLTSQDDRQAQYKHCVLDYVAWYLQRTQAELLAHADEYPLLVNYVAAHCMQKLVWQAESVDWKLD